MIDRLLICTDLDRTLIPNGPQAESPHARDYFANLVNRAEVTLAYVSGRHRQLVEQAISNYHLPVPDYVIGDVGTTIYHVGLEHDWHRQLVWEKEIAQDWGEHSHADLKALLEDLSELRLQENAKQNDYKLSYYVPLQSDSNNLSKIIRTRLEAENIKANQIWSVDELNGIGLLDILPARASKYHAIKALMAIQGFDDNNTVFCGDSGNDLEVLASPIPAVLVANSQWEVQQQARQLADEMDHREQLYLAHDHFMGMNGNYSGGMLEGIAHYYPETITWMGFEMNKKEAP